MFNIIIIFIVLILILNLLFLKEKEYFYSDIKLDAKETDVSQIWNLKNGVYQLVTTTTPVQTTTTPVQTTTTPVQTTTTPVKTTTTPVKTTTTPVQTTTTPEKCSSVVGANGEKIYCSPSKDKDLAKSWCQEHCNSVAPYLGNYKDFACPTRGTYSCCKDNTYNKCTDDPNKCCGFNSYITKSCYNNQGSGPYMCSDVQPKDICTDTGKCVSNPGECCSNKAVQTKKCYGNKGTPYECYDGQAPTECKTGCVKKKDTKYCCQGSFHFTAKCKGSYRCGK